MTYLVDTHLLIWTLGGPERRSAAAESIMEDLGNVLHFSAIAIWEVAIKSGRRARGFDLDPERMRTALQLHGYRELPITGAHAAATARLPRIHKDPFDRLLIAQATVEGMTLLTSDAQIARYPGPIRLV